MCLHIIDKMFYFSSEIGSIYANKQKYRNKYSFRNILWYTDKFPLKIGFEWFDLIS